MSLGEQILKARREKGLSQEALAERLGVSRQAVSKWETNEARPDTDKLMALCRELDMSADGLLFGEKAAPKEAPAHGKRPLYMMILAALVIFALGLLTGRELFPREVTVEVPPSLRVQDIEIADADISFEGGYWLMSLMPENPAEGLQVSFLIEQKQEGTTSVTAEAAEEGAYFKARSPRQHYGSAVITAQLELAGEIKRVPLMRAYNIDETGHHLEILWK